MGGARRGLRAQPGAPRPTDIGWEGGDLESLALRGDLIPPDGCGPWAPGSLHKLCLPVPARDLEGAEFGAEGLGWAPEAPVLALELQALAPRLRCSSSPGHQAQAGHFGNCSHNLVGQPGPTTWGLVLQRWQVSQASKLP